MGRARIGRARIGRARVVVVGAVATVGMLLAACGGSGTADSPSGTIPAPDGLPAFYAVPDPLPEGPPGTLIASEVVSNSEATVTRVMYLSTAADGSAIPVTGLVIVPAGPAPPGGRPVLSWAHGTTGIADSCTPSLDATQLLLLAGPLLAQGYVVTATDYEALGTPGRHAYLVGPSAGRTVIDAVRAARTIAGPTASTEYLVWGHSQGGHAALFAGNEAADYAPELSLTAVVAGAPPSQFTALYADLQTGSAEQFQILAAAGFNAAYGDDDAPLDEVLTPAGLDWLANVDRSCSSDLGAGIDQIDPSTLLRADPATVPAWRELLEANDPASFTTAFPAPLLIVHGDADPLIPIQRSVTLFDQLCRTGQVGQLWNFTGRGHADVVLASLPSMLQWMNDRRAGAPMPDPLTPAGAVVSSCN